MNLDVGQDGFSLEGTLTETSRMSKSDTIKSGGDTRMYKVTDCREFGAAEEQNKGTAVHTK